MDNYSDGSPRRDTQESEKSTAFDIPGQWDGTGTDGVYPYPVAMPFLPLDRSPQQHYPPSWVNILIARPLQNLLSGHRTLTQKLLALPGGALRGMLAGAVLGLIRIVMGVVGLAVGIVAFIPSLFMKKRTPFPNANIIAHPYQWLMGKGLRWLAIRSLGMTLTGLGTLALNGVLGSLVLGGGILAAVPAAAVRAAERRAEQRSGTTPIPTSPDERDTHPYSWMRSSDERPYSSSPGYAAPLPSPGYYSTSSGQDVRVAVDSVAPTLFIDHRRRDTPPSGYVSLPSAHQWDVGTISRWDPPSIGNVLIATQPSPTGEPLSPQDFGNYVYGFTVGQLRAMKLPEQNDILEQWMQSAYRIHSPTISLDPHWIQERIGVIRAIRANTQQYPDTLLVGQIMNPRHFSTPRA